MSVSESEAYIAAVRTIIIETYYALAAFDDASCLRVCLHARSRGTLEVVWGRKTTGATVLFVLNRYWLFFEYITQVITTFPITVPRFEHILATMCISMLNLLAVVMSSATWSSIFDSGPQLRPERPQVVDRSPDLRLLCPALHTKLSDASSVQLSIVIVHRRTDLWVRAREEYLAATDYMSGSADSDTIGSRTCLIVGDLIVLAITWRSTFGITKAACANAPVTDECHSEDGAIYIVCHLILNVVNIVVNAVAVRDSVPFQGAAYGQVPVSRKTAQYLTSKTRQSAHDRCPTPGAPINRAYLS
ncbi:hypothetical protein NUW54_g11795 [Trametes sanguinea]|uniref:Uncharacterized protein n=1 Tax=Trametes sanguinea TaxID=158606 RepID=A0ACC1N6Y2_9APHY|nr:hypothetical protein NUW54_g11795 [Trametes sanguinea]